MSQFVADQPCDLTPQQTTALAKVLRRSPEATRNLIEGAKDAFLANIPRYVEAHQEATEAALLNGDAKSLAVVTEAAQWAIEHASGHGARMVDRPEKAESGHKVLIGIRVGGVDQERQLPVIEIEGDAITAE